MYRKILLPIDISHSDLGAQTLDLAKKFANENGAKLILLSVIEDIPAVVTVDLPADYGAQAAKEARGKLEELAQQHGLGDDSFELVVRVGRVYREILAFAEEAECDLIIIGSHDPSLSTYLLGSVAARVVRHAHCSVLVSRQ